MTTASQFAKRYAFLTAAPGLYAMTLYNKGLEASIEHAFLGAPGEQNKPWPAHMYINQLQVSEPAGGYRDEWREEIVKSLFAGNIARLWRALSKTAGLPMPILWENTAVRVFSLYEKRMGAGAGKEERLRIEDDFAYLVHHAPGALFGEAQNPFAAFYHDAPTVSSATPPVRMRKTCCFYYQVSAGGEYCTACPKAK
jgi:ferric iron reductase protein FhuF